MLRMISSPPTIRKRLYTEVGDTYSLGILSEVTVE